MKRIRIEKVKNEHGRQGLSGFRDQGVRAKNGGRQRRRSFVEAHVVVNNIGDEEIESGEDGAAATEVDADEKQKGDAKIPRGKQRKSEGEP